MTRVMLLIAFLTTLPSSGFCAEYADFLSQVTGRVREIIFSGYDVYYGVERDAQMEWIGSNRERNGYFKPGDCIEYSMFKYASAYRKPEVLAGKEGNYFYSSELSRCRPDRQKVFKSTDGQGKRVFSDKPLSVADETPSPPNQEEAPKKNGDLQKASPSLPPKASKDTGYSYGRVFEVIHSAQFTFAHIAVDGEEYWIRDSRKDAVKPGSMIKYRTAKPLQSFVREPSINKTFSYNLILGSFVLIEPSRPERPTFSRTDDNGTRVFTDNPYFYGR